MILILVPLLLAAAVITLVGKYRRLGAQPLAFLRDRRAITIGLVVAVILGAISVGSVTFTPLNAVSTVVGSALWFAVAATIAHNLRPSEAMKH